MPAIQRGPASNIARRTAVAPYRQHAATPRHPEALPARAFTREAAQNRRNRLRTEPTPNFAGTNPLFLQILDQVNALQFEIDNRQIQERDLVHRIDDIAMMLLAMSPDIITRGQALMVADDLALMHFEARPDNHAIEQIRRRLQSDTAEARNFFRAMFHIDRGANFAQVLGQLDITDPVQIQELQRQAQDVESNGGPRGNPGNLLLAVTMIRASRNLDRAASEFHITHPDDVQVLQNFADSLSNDRTQHRTERANRRARIRQIDLPER